MRGVCLLFLFVGCIDHPSDPELPADGNGSIAGADDGPRTTPSGSTTTPKKDPPKPATPTLEVLQETVYVLMTNNEDGEPYMCTGTLVSKDRVVTAGHCLERGRFDDYEIVAPLAPGKPRVSASNPTPMSDDFRDVAEPDFGFLTLDEPIELEHYGVLTDVTERVEKGEKLTAAAAVRKEEKREAPLKAVEGLTLRSTTDTGYDHGFGVKLYSHGGDSGAGLFLVEDGQTTHKLIAVEREPDPDTNTDHLTRIDATVLAWYRENAGE